MLKYLNTYRSFLFGILTLCYVFSVFQKPITEFAHLMIHAPGILFSEEKIHSFYAHKDDSHGHENLELLEISSSDEGEQPQSQNELEIKKKIEISDNGFKMVSQYYLKSKRSFIFILPHYFVFYKIHTPPPQFA